MKKPIVTNEQYNGWLCGFKSSKIKLWRFIIDSRAEVIKQTVNKWGVSKKTAESYYSKYIPDLISLLATDMQEREQYLQEHYYACNVTKLEAHLLRQKKIEKGLLPEVETTEPKKRIINKWSIEELDLLTKLYENYKDSGRKWIEICTVLNAAFHDSKPIRTPHAARSRYDYIIEKAIKEEIPKVNKGANQEKDEIVIDTTEEEKQMTKLHCIICDRDFATEKGLATHYCAEKRLYVEAKELNETQTAIKKRCELIKHMLLNKNKQYGNSVMSPIRVFSKADKTEQLRVRIDDKINRLLQGDESIESDVDVIDDLIGYLILLRISMGG